MTARADQDHPETNLDATGGALPQRVEESGSVRWRAEAWIALIYALAIPLVVFGAGVVQILVYGVSGSATVPPALNLLNKSVAAALAGAYLYLLIRLVCEENVTGARLSRWPLRLAPVLLAAAVPTVAAWLVLERGQALNGLLVIPALALWGGVAGDTLAHWWLARGRDGFTLVRRAFFAALLATAVLVVIAVVLR